jgi:DNA end-binding protein Ku
MPRTQAAERAVSRTSRKPRAAGTATKARTAPPARGPRPHEGGGAQAQAEAHPSGPRSFWSGTITFGLVSVPVQLWPAVRSSALRMRMLSPEGLPLKRRYVCPREDRDVTREEIVRGFELDDGKHVTLTDEELESVEPRKSRDIDLRLFVDAGELNPLLFERTYVLTPGGQTEKPYRLLADVMEREHKAGIATFVMRDKEYLVAIFADRGILQAETLRFATEVRSAKDVGLPEATKAPAKLVASFEHAIRGLKKADLARAELGDERLERLRKLVEHKRTRGEDVVEATAIETGPDEALDDEEETSGVDLLEAIRRSMRGEPATRAASGPAQARPARREPAARRAARTRAPKPTGRESAARKKSGAKPSKRKSSTRAAAKRKTRGRAA